jgi:hypothetical protein
MPWGCGLKDEFGVTPAASNVFGMSLQNFARADVSIGRAIHIEQYLPPLGNLLALVRPNA